MSRTILRRQQPITAAYASSDVEIKDKQYRQFVKPEFLANESRFEQSSRRESRSSERDTT